MESLKAYLMSFALGAVIYGLIEVIVRGYTHWTMALAGGLVMVIFYYIGAKTNLGLLGRCVVGALVITAIEFTIGMIVNRGLGWNVWDYSDRPFNVLGQICPKFTVGWFFLSIPAFFVTDRLREYFSLR